MINTPKQLVVQVMPTPEQFATWVEQSIAALEMTNSKFLLEENRPGSKNRVANFLKKPGSIAIGTASTLQAQILQTAVRQGVYLNPMEIVSLKDAMSTLEQDLMLRSPP